MEGQATITQNAPFNATAPVADQVSVGLIIGSDPISVKKFMADNSFVSVHREVRENSVGYPYITFISKDNVSENIYFSRNEAVKHAAGDLIQKGFFDSMQVWLTHNAAGEPRVKLTGLGGEGGLRVNAADLF